VPPESSAQAKGEPAEIGVATVQAPAVHDVAPLHSVYPPLQPETQTPLPLQLAVAFGSVVVHAVPQPPQLLLSVCSLTHAPLHRLSLVGQLVPHDVPLHVALPPVGAGHAVHEVVPQLLGDVLLEHVPLQL
jgi:hypothetical protein